MDLLALKRSLMPMSGPQDMGGGGGGGNTSQQTQVSELPEWAKPYAKNTLEKSAALTEKPYQTYDAPRIAGFSPLQQQAQQGAAQMQTSGLTGLGGGLAAGAGLGGLGYAMQQNPQNFQQNVGGYMNPYLQYSLAPQIAEANRQYDITGTKQQSAATQAGAFGGSREAIMAAENERNRNMGLQNIIGQGYNTAFQNAQNQYNQSQQAQLQGLNTALQGAGQLGALGGQQFQQGMDINKLQSAYGGQQQALQQQGLDTAYQDFINQQNYPYKQLGFMSDMIRGLPLGQQSTQSLYQGPGSLAGQVAGLGMGAYGLSKLSNFMAEGGEVHGYADGGSVESTGNIEAIVKRLSDAQLQQAAQAAQARGDVDQLEAIQNELAMRASERGGMAGAFNSLPAESQDSMMQMAGGGVVAFADGDLVRKPVPERATSALGDFWRTIGGEGAVNALREYNAKTSERDRQISDAEDLLPGLTGSVTPTERARRVAAAERMLAGDQPVQKLSQAELAAKQQEFKNSSPYASKSTESFLSSLTGGEAGGATGGKNKEVESGTKGGISNHPVVRQATQIAKAAGVPQETFEDAIKRIRKEISGEDEAFKKEMAGHYQKAVDRLNESKKQAGAEALMQYGFGLAREASRPGARFMGSIAGASPILSQALMESNKVNRAAEDNLDKMRMDQLRFEQSMRRGDYKDAAQMAGLISADKKAQRQLDLQEKQLGIMAAHYGQAGISNIGKIVNEMQRDPEFAKLPAQEQFERASRIAGYSFRTDAANAGRLQTALANIEKMQLSMEDVEGGKPAESLKRRKDLARQEAYRLYGQEQPTDGVSGNNYAGFKLVN